MPREVTPADSIPGGLVIVAVVGVVGGIAGAFLAAALALPFELVGYKLSNDSLSALLWTCVAISALTMAWRTRRAIPLRVLQRPVGDDRRSFAFDAFESVFGIVVGAAFFGVAGGSILGAGAAWLLPDDFSREHLLRWCIGSGWLVATVVGITWETKRLIVTRQARSGSR